MKASVRSSKLGKNDWIIKLQVLEHLPNFSINARIVITSSLYLETRPNAAVGPPPDCRPQHWMVTVQTSFTHVQGVLYWVAPFKRHPYGYYTTSCITGMYVSGLDTSTLHYRWHHLRLTISQRYPMWMNWGDQKVVTKTMREIFLDCYVSFRSHLPYLKLIWFRQQWYLA